MYICIIFLVLAPVDATGTSDGTSHSDAVNFDHDLNNFWEYLLEKRSPAPPRTQSNGHKEKFWDSVGYMFGNYFGNYHHK